MQCLSALVVVSPQFCLTLYMLYATFGFKLNLRLIIKKNIFFEVTFDLPLS